MYYPTGSVTTTSGNFDLAPPAPALTDVRYVNSTTTVKARYSPLNTTQAGTLNAPESVRYLGKKEGDYALVEYDIFNSDKKKRAWFPHMSLREAPSPSPSTVYASVAAVNSTLSSASMTQNAKYICSYLMSLGFTKNAACGVLGNMQEESDIDPGVWQVMNDLTKGYGLVQFTKATKFLDRAVSYGVISSATAANVNALVNGASPNPKKLMDAQLECLMWRLTAGNDWLNPSASGHANNTGLTMTLAQFMSSTKTADVLAQVFHDYYERSGNTASYPTRKANALTWYSSI